MERKDYTTQISHYIPNEVIYHFVFPLEILYGYNGELDVTVDDNLAYFIIEPILKRNIAYSFQLIWKDEGANKLNHSLDICIKVDGTKFNFKTVIDNLEKEEMITGLELFKEEYSELKKVVWNA